MMTFSCKTVVGGKKLKFLLDGNHTRRQAVSSRLHGTVYKVDGCMIDLCFVVESAHCEKGEKMVRSV